MQVGTRVVFAGVDDSLLELDLPNVDAIEL